MVKTEKAETPETMDDNLDTDALTPEEAAYFESGGETEPAPPEDKGEDGEKPAEPEVEAKSEETPDTEKDGDDKQDDDGKSKFVPHQALHAEREEHKKTRSELDGFREKWAALEERQRVFQELQQQQNTEEPAKPIDPDEDIFGAFKQQQEELAAIKAQIAERDQSAQQMQQSQSIENLVWGAWNESVEQFKAETPDYEDAARWLADYRDNQLKGYATIDARYNSQQARNEHLNGELRNIVIESTRQGVSPAQAVYDLAKSYGFTGEKTEMPEDQINGATEKLEKLEKAQQSNKTVGQGHGGGAAGEITPEAIAAMSDTEFNAWISDKANARKFNAMMGG
ncbi:MAG: hypothetical protein ACPG4X_19690 [Pikeienuella sp.]